LTSAKSLRRWPPPVIPEAIFNSDEAWKTQIGDAIEVDADLGGVREDDGLGLAVAG
jgi:hypothetical protein